MRAVQYTEVGGPIELVELADPRPPVGGVVLRVAATGVCRSDWHAWRGHDPVPLPMVPGHEFAGTVAAIGDGVTRFAVGDRVTAPFVNGCGHCRWCASGDSQVCPDQRQPGFTDPGSFAEYVVVTAADHNLVALPEAVSFVAAAGLGCRFATAYRALTAHGRPEPGDWLAVHGCGGAGLSVVMIGKALGANVIGVDVSDAALSRASDLGADLTLRADAHDGPEALAEAIVTATGGVSVSVDAIGRPDTVVASVLSLLRRGRHVQVGLLLGDDARTAVPMDRVVSAELALLGSHGMAAQHYPPMLELIVSGALDPLRLVGSTAALDVAGRALAAMDAPAGDGMTILLP